MNTRFGGLALAALCLALARARLAVGQEGWPPADERGSVRLAGRIESNQPDNADDPPENSAQTAESEPHFGDGVKALEKELQDMREAEKKRMPTPNSRPAG